MSRSTAVKMINSRHIDLMLPAANAEWPTSDAKSVQQRERRDAYTASEEPPSDRDARCRSSRIRVVWTFGELYGERKVVEQISPGSTGF